MTKKHLSLQTLVGFLAVVGVVAFAAEADNGLGTGIQNAIQQLEGGAKAVSQGGCNLINVYLPILLYGSSIAAVIIGGIIRALAPNSRIWSLMVWGGLVATLLFVILIPAIQNFFGGDRCRDLHSLMIFLQAHA